MLFLFSVLKYEPFHSATNSSDNKYFLAENIVQPVNIPQISKQINTSGERNNIVSTFLLMCLFIFTPNGRANMPDYDRILPLQTTTLSIVGESWHAKAVCKRGES